MTSFVINIPGEIDGVAKQIYEHIKSYQIIAFYGQMGAGKTTLISAILKHAGVTDRVNSPTFSIVNEYKTINNSVYYHFDFYRVESLQELANIGVSEYFDSGFTCLLEWPEKVDKILPENTLKIDILVEGNTRIINIH